MHLLTQLLGGRRQGFELLQKEFLRKNTKIGDSSLWKMCHVHHFRRSHQHFLCDAAAAKGPCTGSSRCIEVKIIIAASYW